jgi:hypothetical protein
VAGDRGGGDVHDGVHSAHLVKVHLVQGDAVDPGLGATQRLEDGQRPLAHSRRQSSRLEHTDDVAEVPTVVVAVSVRPGLAPARAARRLDPHVARGQRPPAHPRHAQLVRHLQAGQIRLQLLAREAGIQERPHEHVAGHAGEAVQVQNPRPAQTGPACGHG